MNIEFYKNLVTIVNCKSISKAAVISNISQSALSQQIKNAENLLGIKIFTRNHKGIELTETGKIIYKYATTITSSYTNMLHEIKNSANGSKTFRILATPIINSHALPCTLYHVKNTYPAYNLEMEGMPSDTVEDKIGQGIGDMGFIIGKPKDKNLYSKKVFSDKYYLVCGFEMDIPEEINITTLYKYPIIMLSKARKTRRILEHFFLKVGLDTNRLKILYELDSIESIKSSSIKGYGMAFLPYMAIKKELYNKQLKIVHLKNFNLENEYYAIRNRNLEQIDLEHLHFTSYFEKVVEETIC